MKNNKDYIYEYSDLNLFHTRVKILTGDYTGIIIEFGGSYLESNKNNNRFVFDYTLYQKPDNPKVIIFKGDDQFEKYLSNLLINIINDRRKDKKEQEKLQEAASSQGVKSSRIKIDAKFYDFIKESTLQELQNY